MVFDGIDFANRERSIGRCRLEDDGVTLQLQLQPAEEGATLTAVDCAFGTSLGFQQLLDGNVPQDLGDDGFKTRQTERWLRRYVGAFATNNLWRNRTAAERAVYPRHSYFNGGAHVQSTLALQIVPACLAWLAEELGPGVDPNQRLQILANARRGDARIVEAHPRPFLYSIIERLHQHDAELITLEMLKQVADYKNKKEPHAEHRASIYRLLVQNPGWMQPVRAFAPNEPPAELIESDHTFDAWLCCLTAWAHHHGQTLGWQAAGINRELVDVEGHILVLS